MESENAWQLVFKGELARSLASIFRKMASTRCRLGNLKAIRARSQVFVDPCRQRLIRSYAKPDLAPGENRIVRLLEKSLKVFPNVKERASSAILCRSNRCDSPRRRQRDDRAGGELVERVDDESGIVALDHRRGRVMQGRDQPRWKARP